MHPSQQGQPGRHPYHYNNNNNSHQNNLGARAAYALTSALADPYGQARASYYSYINQNYAQAYFNQMLLHQQQRMPRTTEEGYTLSSTYDPSSQEPAPTFRNNQSASSSSSRNASRQNFNQTQTRSNPSTNNQQRYNNNNNNNTQSHPPYRRPQAAGDIKCTYPGCSFSGSKHTVEIHRMDRHLIYPPGWKKKTDDWDADPSLKGKPIPILGTGLILNTPESIDAWIAERKKRWPSKQNIEEKKKREQEAVQRGEINPSELSRLTAKGIGKRRLGNNEEHRQRRGALSHKRARITDVVRSDDNQTQQSLESSSVAGTSREKKEGGGVTLFTATGPDNPSNPATDNHNQIHVNSNHALNTTPSDKSDKKEEDGDEEDEKVNDNDDDDNADEDDDQSSSDVDPVRDAISSKRPVDMPEECPPPAIAEEQNQIGQSTLQQHQLSAPQHAEAENTTLLKNKKSHPHPHPQPKRPTRNPFSSKNHLLRNLLLPEIRNTISNLSQAIHFLAENDFLIGVELKPGDADAQLIQVLDNKNTS